MLTPAQAAQVRGLSPQRIRALCAQARIPGAVRVGKSWIIPAEFTILATGTRGPKSVKF